MKKLIALTIILISMLSSQLALAAVVDDKLAVAVGQSQVLEFNGIERVAVANPEVADVVVVSGVEILLVGKSAGMTTLQVWTISGRQSFIVEVAANDPSIANEIKNILGFQDVRVSKVGKTVVLEGKVNDRYQKDRAEKVASAYGEKIINLLEITRPLQVKIEAKVVEINRNDINNLGIKWGNSATSAPGVFGFGQSSTNGYVSNGVLGGLNKYYPLNAQLDALLKNGSARILSQPNMITLSGEKASIMVGGQIPIPVAYTNGQLSVEWKEYGIKLDIQPEVNDEGLINSKIKAEVSSLDWNSLHRIQLGSNIFIPPLKMSKAETAIALSSGQTMAIGGLIASEIKQDVTKVPLLANIPIIGKLFKSSSFNRDETELLILVTPTLVDPATYLPQGTEEMKGFLKEDPWEVNKNGGKDKGSNR